VRDRGGPARARQANVAYIVDKERRYVGGAFIPLDEKMRERLWARVNAKAKPLKTSR
jgi:hypothetical protein